MKAGLAAILVAGAVAIAVGQVVGPPGRPTPPIPTVRGTVPPKQFGAVTEVTGQVVDTNGRLVSTAVVRLIGVSSNRTALTDVKGRFTFTNIVPGEYVVTASKHGFYDGAFGKRRPSGDPLPVSLSAGQNMQDMRIELFSSGVITGSVLDEANEPVIGALVVAMRRIFVEGSWQFVAAGSDLTDDYGRYRVFGLQPGEYLVSTPTAQVTPGLQGLVVAPDLPHTEDLTLAYPTLFYPASRYFLLSQTLHLASGEVKYAVNFQWSPVPARAVHGKLTGAITAIDSQVVKLVPLDTREVTQGNEAAVTISGRDGSFVFERVPAGEYRLEAGGRFRSIGVTDVMSNPTLVPPEVVWGRATVTVIDEDVHDVVVPMRTGVQLRGVVVAPRPTSGSPPFSAARISVTVVPTKHGLTRIVGATVGPGTQFTASNLIPGEYFVRIGNLPAGWYLDSVVQGGRDLLDEPADLKDGEGASVLVTVTDRPTTIQGSVRDSRLQAAAGATVIVMPASLTHWSPNRTRQTRASTNGQFAIRGLPAGDYFIVAVDDAAAEGWQDETRLPQFRTLSTRFSLRSEENRTIHLRLSAIKR